MSEARANVPTVFSDMPIGIRSLSVPIVYSIKGGTFIPKNPKKPKMNIPLCTSVIVGPWSVYSYKTSNHDD